VHLILHNAQQGEMLLFAFQNGQVTLLSLEVNSIKIRFS
jgi:hypothetical protein